MFTHEPSKSELFERDARFRAMPAPTATTAPPPAIHAVVRKAELGLLASLPPPAGRSTTADADISGVAKGALGGLAVGVTIGGASTVFSIFSRLIVSACRCAPAIGTSCLRGT